MDLQPIGARLMILSVMRRKRIRMKTADSALHHGQLPLLERILEHPGSTQQQIASQLLVTPASVAQSMTRLEKAGLIERRTDPDNRRKNRVYATAAGRNAAALYRKSFDEVDSETFSGLNDGELAQFAALLDRMIANMSDTGMDGCPFLEWKGETPE